MNYQDFAKVIIQMKEADLTLRKDLIQSGKLGDSYNKEMAALHNRNAELLSQIIDDIGYPTVDKVGKAANEAAWLIIQHAIGQPDFMKKCAKLLAAEIVNNPASAIQHAYLTDRIAFYEGKAQLYGTQFDWDENGELSPSLYDDKTKVNERRKALGLNTLEEQTKIIRQQAENENQFCPSDLAQRKADFLAWRKKIGWL